MSQPTFTPYSNPRNLQFHQGPLNLPKVALASFCRSGNTFLRNLLEQISGLYTGSDMQLDQSCPFTMSLYNAGMQGEGIVDDRCWIVKTHFPELDRLELPFIAQKAIVLVRNPFDVIDSYFNMGATGSHSKSIDDGEYLKFADHWENFIAEKSEMWSKFHDFWLNAEVPTYVVRYEDLRHDPQSTMTNLFKFLLGSDSFVKSGIKTSIDAYFDDQSRKQTVYKPRSGTILTSLKHYTRNQLKTILSNAQREINLFGYFDPSFLKFAENEQQVEELRKLTKDLKSCPESKMAASKSKTTPFGIQYVRVNETTTCDVPTDNYYNTLVTEIRPIVDMKV